MSGRPSKWTCDLCSLTMAATHKGNHVHWQCPMQGNGKKKAEAARLAEERRAAGIVDLPKPVTYWQHLPCICGCGESVGQVKGQKKKYYLNTEHYEKHRAILRSKQLRAEKEAGIERPSEEEQEEASERKLAQEMAPIASKQEAIARVAEATSFLTGATSHALWGACLGVEL